MTPEIRLEGRKGQIVAAALALATERPWKDVALRDIAERAGLSLVDMREHVQSKADVLAAFARAVDDAVLAASGRGVTVSDPKRDQLFEVVMARFDALQPYRAALKSISADASADPALLRAMISSQAWMLQAAGIDTGGVEGGVRVAGLAAVYASVYRTWLEDDDPGLARTMAALDRRLRRGERTLQTFDDIGRSLRGAGEWLQGVVRRGASAAKPPASDAAPPTANDNADDVRTV